MMTFAEIKDKIRKNDYIVSQHAFIESAKDELEDEDIRFAILNGQIIEVYPGDKRGESVLVGGMTRNERPLHIVMGVAQENLVLITVYVPTLPKWTSPTDRGGSKK